MPYTITTTPLESAYVFAKLMCGIELHAGQIEFIDSPAPDKTACCGRQWGKTLSMAVDMLKWAQAHPKTKQFVVAPTHDQASIIFSMMESMIADGPIGELVKGIKNAPFKHIIFKNGSSIHARSVGLNGKYLRGNHADRIVIDECAFIPLTVMEEVLPQMLATSKYGHIVRISTPFGMNHFHAAYERGQSDNPRYASFRYPTWLNPFVNREQLQAERETRTKLAWDVEYGATFNEDQNAMFPWSVIERCIDDEMDDEYDPIPGHTYAGGYDPAKWNDRSGLIITDVINGEFYLARCLDIGGRDYTIQEREIAYHAARYNNAPFLMDSTKHEPVLEACIDLGIEMAGFHFGNQSKWELISGLAREMEQGRVHFARIPELLREFQYYQMVRTGSGNVKLGAPEEKGVYDDLVTAFALSVLQGKNPPDVVDLTMAKW